MKVLILAAGYATRLYPLTKDYPKPLLEVKGKPIINYLIEQIGIIPAIDEIFVVTNSKFIPIFRKWAKSIKSKQKITLVCDQTKNNRDRLGAIGDLNFVVLKKKIRQDLLVIGGDNLFNGSLAKFINFSRQHVSAASLGLFRLKQKKDASRYGVVVLNAQDKVTGFWEKPKAPKSNLVAMCLYYIPKDCLGLSRDYLQEMKNKVDATGSYIAWLKNKIAIYGYVFGGAWFDIGDYKYLNAAKNNFAKN